MTAPASESTPAEDAAAVPSAGDILQAVATKLELTPVQIERTLAEANITLKSPAAADRRVRIVRLSGRLRKSFGG